MSWEAGASLGTFPDGSQAKAPPFSGEIRRRHLPCFGILAVRIIILLTVFVVIIFVFVFVEIILVIHIVGDLIGDFLRRIVGHFGGDHVVGSVAAFGFGCAGGGYVVQKWRPHCGHTQN